MAHCQFLAMALASISQPIKARALCSQLRAQVLGVVATAAYAGVVSFIVLILIDLLTPLRALAETEQQGIGVVQPRETGYNL